MKEGYSIKKGLGKGLKPILVLIVSALAISGFGEISVWDLIVQHIKPFVGTATLSSLALIALNFVKFNWLSEKPV